MSEDHEVFKQRLLRLSAAQRALLTRRLGGERTNAQTTGEARASMPKEPPRRVDVDGEGRQVAVFPASNGQQRMWFMHRYMPDSPVYCRPTAFHLRGRLEVAMLEVAFDRMIQRHQILRTSFAMEEGELVQRIESSSTFRLEQVPATHALAEGRKMAAEHCIAKAACQPFDLTTAPPFRVVLASIEHDEHLLLVVMHHIISDGWSVSNLCRELSAIYAALTAGAPVALPELSMQFTDYSAWQGRRLERGALDGQATYWTGKLAGEPEPLEIPMDRTRPSGKSFRGDDCSLEIDGELVTALKARARERNATLFMVLLAAFKVLLHRYTGQTDVLVGVPIANRQHPEIEGLIGLFANTLVMRTAVSGDTTFEELVHRVKRTALEAYENQDMPFELLVRLLQVRRDASRTPLFQVSFALQDFPESSLQLTGVEVTPFPVSTHTSKFDLSLEVRPTCQGLMATMEFSLDLFAPDRARRMLEHWHAVLLDVAAHPSRRVSEVSLLSPAEKHRVLVEWNRTERDYPRDKCIHEVFEEQVERTPDAVAVVFERNSLSYQELNSRANRLSDHLRALGVGPNALVGLCVERSFEMIIGVLGILKAGGAYWALEENLPEERLRLMLAGAQPRVLLFGRKSAKSLPDLMSKLAADSLAVVSIEELLESSPKETKAAMSPNRASDPAYVNYTSGSTGQPKGVVVPHRGVVRLVKGTDYASLSAEETLLHLSPLSFDASTFELWGALLNGGRVVVLPPGPLTLAEIGQAIRLHGVTSVWLTAGLFHLMVDERLDDLKPLRQLLAGGDVLSPEHVRKARRALPDCRIINGYGPTENTTFTCCYTVVDESELAPSVPIGRPIANTQVYILDEARQPVPVGVAGELYAGGDGVACGYLHQPQLTAQRFVPHPFSAQPGARLYQSGDRVRWRPDGNIEFLGRLDSQVKIRGFRVELGEIEAVLSGHPEVALCAVVAQDISSEDQALVAFVVGRENAEPSGRSLRQLLGQKLPDYMIPSRFVKVPALPLNSNGKLDPKALLKLDGVELVSGTEYMAPRNQRERELVEIWQAVLRRTQIGVQDNFFDLGGHSLLAVSMCLRMTSLLRVEVPLRWILEHPTIEGLANRLGSLEGELQIAEAIEKVERQKPLPMSFAQQQMWLLQQTSPDQATYNQPVAWHFSGKVDREKVRRALQSILERHEILRTALLQKGEKLLQQIASANDAPLAWKEIDLRAVSSSQKQATLEGLMVEEARRPFDLAQAPLWRVVWIELVGDEHVLAFTFHHSIVDEWSLRQFFQELEVLYASSGQVKHANLPDLPIQYADYSAWERRRLTGTLLQQQRHYWTKRLRDLPSSLELPADVSRPPQLSGRGAVHHFRLIDPLVSGFRTLARQEGTTLFTVVLAAFQVWLHRYTGQTDLIVGTPIANRQRPEVKALLGCFLNTLPIRVRVDGSESFTEVLGQVRELVFEAFGHAKLPFEQIVELAIKERNSGEQSLYQVMFVLLEEELTPLRLHQAQSRLLPMETRTSKNDLTLSIRAVDQSLACRLEYATDLFSPRRAASMARHLTELFRSLTKNPHKRISGLNLLPEAERNQILVEWNRTERDYPRDKCIHEVFEEQVERTPDGVAIVFERNSLSYQELNSRANRLSDHLRALGVGPNVLVGLCVERSFEMIIGVLGILKAGGAYWALEENLPEERLRLMLADARPRVLLFARNSAKPPPDLMSKSAADSLAVVSIEELLESSPKETKAAMSPNRASDPAYVNYTSGSTGQPKGVVVPHRGVVRLVKGTDYASLSAEETFLHLSPLSFDASTFELWGALLNGGRVVVLPPGPPTLAEIGEAIRLHGVTSVWLTAGLFHLMVDERLDDLKSLRQLLAGGDVLSPEHVRKARRALPDCRIINGYGPTENTTFTCCYTVLDESELAPSVPIGRPIANTQVYILDEARQPVPVGVAGELYAGGDGVACGYLHRPQLTAQRFVPHPFSAQPGARLYQTGDRARWRPDGNIEFLGRLDSQVKIRGFRVELGEVEAALKQHPEVRDTAVVGLGRQGDEKRLSAYVVAESVALRESTLRDYLKLKLPDYMVPSVFVVLDRLPLNANGKVDRGALPEPASTVREQELVPPRDTIETQLVAIWEKVLEKSPIGVTDDFFELGGNSLRAVRVFVEIKKALGTKLPFATLFRTPTVETLAQALRTGTGAEDWSPLVPIQLRGDRPPFFGVHGAYGNVLFYRPLARLLGKEQPFYGVQAQGLDGTPITRTSVEAMAEYYLEEIRKVQPDGPYLLGGYSFGGSIAYEMARRLVIGGEKVPLLVLLDAGNPARPARLVSYAARLRKALRDPSTLFTVDRIARILAGRIRGSTGGRILNWNDQYQRAKARRRKGFLRDEATENDRHVGMVHIRALWAYRPLSFDGKITLFRTLVSEPGYEFDPYLGWDGLAKGGIDVHEVPGAHFELFSDANATAVAKTLEGCIRSALRSVEHVAFAFPEQRQTDR